MKTLPLALCFCLLTLLSANAQQPGPAPILLVYVQKPNESGLIPRIALGLVQPILKISGFEKCAATTAFKGANKLDGIAVQLKVEDAGILAKELNDKIFANSAGEGAVFFATPDNKVLGYTRCDAIKNELGKDGVLAFFADDDAPIFNYLASTLKPR